MFFGIIIVIIFMIAVSSMINFSYSFKIYEKEASKNTQYILDSINLYIDDNMKQVDNITSFLYIDNRDNDRKKVISQQPDNSIENTYRNLKTMDEFYNQILFLKSEINNFYIYLLDGRSYSYYRIGANKMDYIPVGEEWFNKTLEAQGQMVIFPPHLPFQLDRSEKVISYARLLKNQDSNKQEALGVMLIDLPLTSLNSIIERGKLDNGTQMLLLDKSADIIYGKNTVYENYQAQSNLMEKIREAEQGMFMSEIEGKKYLITFGVSKITGWKVVLLSPYDLVSKEGNKLLIFYIIAGVGSIVIGGFFAFLLSSLIYRSLKKLKVGFEQVKKGNLNFQLKTQQKDEMGQLIIEFNTMVVKIKTLIRENFEEKTARSEAELKYLQAQINPHFIYNSLQVISSMAVVKEEAEISTMAKSLARIIKYSVDVDKRIVNFKEELDNVMQYMEVQKIRFDDYLTFETNIDSGLYQYGIIKLVLQPLIENSIVHGIEPKGVKGLICLTAVLEKGDKIRIEVFDNGYGISAERLQKIKIQLETDDIEMQEKEEEDGHTNIGLKNINKRLKIIYGEEAGIKIDSEFGSWTKVGFVVPALYYEEGKRP